ncbi:hypothetical protein PGTUg99_012405 [Puccinia graminis f. sp. tritici]|uniref:Uncharacterized protein n=1 Tax=Puccinia graminis f. sp. tritici TaxID=56615 RepID=A0A5B0RZI3_PUCGR|nr:hypothetical protein PGTUg99_012405 [Puccinia graminis f. sp. tritici]
MRTTEQHAPNTHSYHAPVHSSPTAISPPPTASGQPLLIQTLETPPRSHSSHPSSRPESNCAEFESIRSAQKLAKTYQDPTPPKT